jgi:sulfide:quinone oxidoreductase
MKKALILGGGFAGVQAAIELQKKNIFEVTLISNRDFLYLYPISIWIPTREKSFDDVKVSLAEISAAFRFKAVTDNVVKINSADRKVICTNKTFDYDYLLVAIGADKMQHKGQENTLSICGKPEISLEIRDAIDSLIQKGNGKIAIGFGGNPKDKSAVRGGPAFELMFNLHNLLKKEKVRDRFELTFFASMESPGERMGPKSLIMIDSMFKSYKIEKRFGKKIKIFEPKGIVFEDDSLLESDLTIFIPASTGHSVLKESDLPLTESGFIKIDKNCQVTGADNVYAIGDTAAIEGPEWKAKQGHIAEMMGKVAVHNIIMKESGCDKLKSYIEHINILCIMDTGNGAAFIFRNDKKALAIPMPGFGHWVKKGWGKYTKLTKLGIIPRIPGL